MNGRRIAIAGAVVAVLLAPMVGARAATPEGHCFAQTNLAAGWGGSRFVPVPPQGVVGASCVFHTAGSQFFGVRGQGLPITGGVQMILPDGRRFYCRDGYLETPLVLAGLTLGQAHPHLQCGYNLFDSVELSLFLPAPVAGDVYCSTTGELGIQVEINCFERT